MQRQFKLLSAFSLRATGLLLWNKPKHYKKEGQKVKVSSQIWRAAPAVIFKPINESFNIIHPGIHELLRINTHVSMQSIKFTRLKQRRQESGCSSSDVKTGFETWEQMPRFQSWGQPVIMVCKNLHAHRELGNQKHLSPPPVSTWPLRFYGSNLQLCDLQNAFYCFPHSQFISSKGKWRQETKKSVSS